MDTLQDYLEGGICIENAIEFISENRKLTAEETKVWNDWQASKTMHYFMTIGLGMHKAYCSAKEMNTLTPKDELAYLTWRKKQPSMQDLLDKGYSYESAYRSIKTTRDATSEEDELYQVLKKKERDDSKPKTLVEAIEMAEHRIRWARYPSDALKKRLLNLEAERDQRANNGKAKKYKELL